MNMKKLPFNVQLLTNDKRQIAGLLPVQTADIYSKGGGFNPQGLYSAEIFGDVVSPNRQRRASYIDTRTEIMHPKVFMELVRVKGIYGAIMSGAIHATWDAKINDFVKSNIIDGQTGYSFFMSHFHDLIYLRNDSSIRDLRIDFLNKVHGECMYRYIMVIPAGLREIDVNDGGRVVEDDINALYRKIIRAANTISVYANKHDDPVLDTVRWKIQQSFNEIYEYIESILSGKHGFLLSKWAAREIHGGTRNVITAMDPSPTVLGGEDAVSVNDTMTGLHQYLKGTVEVSIYNIKQGPMVNIINNLPNDIYVVDAKTWRRKQIEPSQFVKDNWGTESGIEKLINGFGKLNARHKPIMIDGDYAALIYRDDKYYHVFYDIDDLPPGKSRSHVKPITWGEMFYISVYVQSTKLVGFVTRYPILELGSIYPSSIYLRSTVKSQILQKLDDSWTPVTTEPKAIKMPIVGEPWFDSMSVHPSHIEALGADYDGDLHYTL